MTAQQELDKLVDNFTEWKNVYPSWKTEPRFEETRKEFEQAIRRAREKVKAQQPGTIPEASAIIVYRLLEGKSPDKNPPTAEDKAKVDEIVNDSNLPDIAEESKAYVVHWADGRGICAFKKKSQLYPWLETVGDWAEIVSIKYKEPVDSDGSKLKVSSESRLSLARKLLERGGYSDPLLAAWVMQHQPFFDEMVAEGFASDGSEVAQYVRVHRLDLQSRIHALRQSSGRWASVPENELFDQVAAGGE